jgi:hypothetical protein
MRQVSYADAAGRQFVTMIPDAAPDSEARKGVPVGPPSLTPLGLPKQTEVRLHNQLFSRGLLTQFDVEQRPGEVVAAVLAAFKTDALRVMALYSGQDMALPE